MWNRHGQRLTIEREFDAVLNQLRPLAGSGLVWADCEALERRHQIGRGSLVVLDWIPESGSPTYEARREFLAKLVETECLSTGEWQSFPENALCLHPTVVGNLPVQCAALNMSNVQGLVVEASFSGDPELVVNAVPMAWRKMRNSRGSISPNCFATTMAWRP